MQKDIQWINRFSDSLKMLVIAAIMALLASCGGSTDEALNELLGETDETPPSSVVTTPVDDTSSPFVLIGNGSGDSFNEGELSFSTGSETLIANGSTLVSANLVDLRADNVLYTTPTNISFTSTCVQAGTADITSTQTTTNGAVSVVYTANGCTGSDTITASATIGTRSVSATGTITISEPTSGNSGSNSGTATVAIGNGSGSGFTAEQLSLSTGGSSLSAGGSTLISASLVDTSNNNSLYTTATTISFTSPCVLANTATIDATVNSTTGEVSTTYTANGCVGEDIITATATVNSVVLTATGMLNVAAPQGNSIEFVSVSPTSIALTGTGGNGRVESSTATFRVVDTTNTPVPNLEVNFALSTSLGGISLASDSGFTDSEGQVSTRVLSGSVPTSVRVSASFVNPDNQTITTVSDQLTVSTGLPTQNALSIAVDLFNPEGLNRVGIEVNVSIRAADRYSNPVPDGTAFSFRTEGGSIEPSCLTSNGACSVVWRSQEFRPTDGLVTIIATAIGEESFFDNNSNGVYDSTETILNDLSEAFLDVDFDGTFDSGSDEFLDFNSNSSFDTNNSLFNGVSCSTDAENLGHCGSLVHVRATTQIAMSGSFNPNISVSSTSSNITTPGGANIVTVGTALDSTQIPQADLTTTTGMGAQTATARFTFSDQNGNALPSGTTVSFSTTNGSLVQSYDFTVPNSTSPVSQTIQIKRETTPSDLTEGFVEATISIPLANIDYVYQIMAVTDDAAPD